MNVRRFGYVLLGCIVIGAAVNAGLSLFELRRDFGHTWDNPVTMVLDTPWGAMTLRSYWAVVGVAAALGAILGVVLGIPLAAVDQAILFAYRRFFRDDSQTH